MESKEFKKIIGERIRAERRRMNFKFRPPFAKAMAKAVGSNDAVSGEAVRRWEEGKDLPGPEYRRQLVALTGKPEPYFVVVVHEPPRTPATVINNEGELRQLSALEEQVLEQMKDMYPEQIRLLVAGTLLKEASYARFLKSQGVKTFRPISDKAMKALLEAGGDFPPAARAKERAKKAKKKTSVLKGRGRPPDAALPDV